MDSIGYNIHWFLHDLFKVKSKWLCNHGKHLYMIRSDFKIENEEIIEDNVKIIKNYKVWLPPYYKCYCCGKKQF